MRRKYTRGGAYKPERTLLFATRMFGSVVLRDARLSQRAVRILLQVARRPGDSIPQGADDPAEAKGFYRFLESERVDADALWTCVHESTAKALEGVAQAVVLHDTTALMFPHRPATSGLGTMNTQAREALLMHSALALRPDGHLLGLLHNAVWARPPKELGKAAERKHRPREDKESVKWSHGVAEAAAWRDRHSPATSLVHVMDREGDIYEDLQELALGHDAAVVRCAQDRAVEGGHGTVWPHMAAQRRMASRQVTVARTQGQAARRATVAVRAASVTVRPPQQCSHLPPTTLGVVWVHEPDPPAGVAPLDWMLWTTLAVNTAARAWAVVQLYRLRWRIEDFHLTLKSGCRIEDSQLKTAERIEVLLVFCCAVAVRLLGLTHWARTAPEAPCTEVLSDLEWRLLWSHHYRLPVPRGEPPPTVRTAVLMLGRLGGHLGRKSDGLPGVRCLWKAWTRFQILVEGYHIRP